MMTPDIATDIAILHDQITDLIARGTTPEILTETQNEWTRVRHAVNDVCTRVTTADPATAHAVLDRLREMIRALEFEMDSNQA